ncbi:MAG: hypothetical protein WDM80_11625 [Limisphaerales bacterium]
MGFFNFKKKSATDELTSKWTEEMFPGGNQQRLFCAQKVAEICNAKLLLNDALDVFIKAKLRYKIACMMYDGEQHLGISGDELVKYIITVSNGKLSFLEALAVGYYAVFDKINVSANPHAALNQMLAAGFGSNQQGYDCDVIPFAVGEYGLEYTNPIPVRGIGGINVYFARLRTADGSKVFCKRVRPIIEPNQFTVDEYDAFSGNNVFLTKLYVCPYHQKFLKKLREDLC